MPFALPSRSPLASTALSTTGWAFSTRLPAASLALSSTGSAFDERSPVASLALPRRGSAFSTSPLAVSAALPARSLAVPAALPGEVTRAVLGFVEGPRLLALCLAHRRPPRMRLGPFIVPGEGRGCKRAGQSEDGTLGSAARTGSIQPRGSGGAIVGSAGTSSAAVSGRSSSGPRSANHATTAPASASADAPAYSVIGPADS